MGNKESKNTNYQGGYNPGDWSMQSKEGNTRVLGSRQNPLSQIQEYSVSIANQKEFNKGEQLYNLRKNDRELVNTKFSNIRKEDKMCSKSYSGELYTERIPVRLSNITHIPFPDVLHVYNQAFNGYDRLARKVGPFKVDEQCIGVNQQHIVKVWHSSSFDEIYPQHSAKSEQAMIRNIVSIIQGNTDETSMPRQQPVFSQYLFRESNNIGFGEAKRKLEQYANHFNRGVIPNYLNCIAKVGGAENIRGRYIETSSNPSFYYSQIPPNNYFGVAPPLHISQSAVYNNNSGYEHNRPVFNSLYDPSTSQNQFRSQTQYNNQHRQGQNTSMTFGRANSFYAFNQNQNQRVETSNISNPIIRKDSNIQTRETFFKRQQPIVARVPPVAQPPMTQIHEQKTVNYTPETRPPMNCYIGPYGYKPSTNTSSGFNFKPISVPPGVVNFVGHNILGKPNPPEKMIKFEEPQRSQSVFVGQRNLQQLQTKKITQDITQTRKIQNARSLQHFGQRIENRQQILRPQEQKVIAVPPPQVQPQTRVMSNRIQTQTNQNNRVNFQNTQSAPKILNTGIQNKTRAKTQMQAVQRQVRVSPQVLRQPARVVQPQPSVQLQRQPQVQQIQQRPQPIVQNHTQSIVQQRSPQTVVIQQQGNPQIKKQINMQREQKIQRINEQKVVQQPQENNKFTVFPAPNTQVVPVPHKSPSPKPKSQPKNPAQQQISTFNQNIIQSQFNMQKQQNIPQQRVQTVQKPIQKQAVWSQANISQRDEQIAPNTVNYNKVEQINMTNQATNSNIMLSNRNTKLSEANQSISSIGQGQPKTVTDKMFSQIQENSIHNSTRNFYQNLGSNNQYSGDYSPGYDYGEYSKPQSYNKKIQTGETSSDFIEQLKKSQKIPSSIPPPVYEDHNVYKVSQNKYTAEYENNQNSGSNTQENGYSFGNQVGNLDSLSKNTGSKNKINLEQQTWDYKNYDAGSNNYKIGGEQNYQSTTNAYKSNYNNDYRSGTQAISTSNYYYQSNNYNSNDYAPTYEYNSHKQYKEYSGDQLTYGYKEDEHDDNINGYTKKTQNYGDSHQLGYDDQVSGAFNKRLGLDQVELKQSVVENQEYEVEWDPDILADLQANVHNK